jgi:hypothetical protein
MQWMRTLFCSVMILLTLPLFSQVRFGVEGGLVLSNIRYQTYKPEMAFIPRVRMGGLMNIPLQDGWLLNAGLYYTGKGGKRDRTPPEMKIDSVITRTHYAELSFTGGYRFDLDNGNHFVLQGGLYTAYGFLGKVEYKGKPERTERHLHRQDAYFRRVEFGYNASLAHEWKDKLGLRLEFSNSIINIRKRTYEREKNVVFSLTGYWFFPGGKN